MTDIEELKRRVQELELQLSHALMAADAEARFADEFKAKYEAEKIERQTFQHGHRIASDNCVRLERELEEARKRRSTPNEMFAIVIDRSYDGEGLSLAVHDGINYMFSDGDCYDRDGDTLDGYTAEFLTQHQLEKKLEEARKDAERMDWIIDNHTSTGGGNGFELRVWIPHDSECVRDAIDHTRLLPG